MSRFRFLRLLPSETYGPSVRSYPQPHWPDLPLAERAKLLARQGHSVILADDVRVVKLLNNGETGDVLVDVKRDGEEVGEVVMRGNTVMKEVGQSLFIPLYLEVAYCFLGKVLP